MSVHTRNRIIHCVRSPVGGIFRHIEDLIRGQSDAGHDVGLIYDSLTETDVERAHAERMAPYLSLGIATVPMTRSLSPSDLKSVLAIRRAITRHNPTVLHGHGAKGGAYARMTGALMRLTRQRVAVLYSPHGGSLHYDANKTSGRVYFTIERLFERFTHGLAFVCQYEAQTYRDKIGSPRCASKVIHNGLRSEEFIPVEPAGNAADFVFVGTLRDLKGPDLLLQALANLQQIHPKKLTAEIVGDGEDRPYYETMAKTLGLANHVTFRGSLPARHAFTLGRCVVLPSRAEAFPYIVLEALAAQRPVITTNVGGIPEIFPEPQTRLIAPDNVSTLQAQMADYLKTPDKWDERALNERSRIEELFRADLMSKSMLDYYTLLCRKAQITTSSNHSGGEAPYSA